MQCSLVQEQSVCVCHTVLVADLHGEVGVEQLVDHLLDVLLLEEPAAPFRAVRRGGPRVVVGGGGIAERRRRGGGRRGRGGGGGGLLCRCVACTDARLNRWSLATSAAERNDEDAAAAAAAVASASGKLVRARART